MNYGSQNTEEESAFIRRVVAPPKRNDSTRRKQKRMVAVGGAVALLAAGAAVAYVTIPGDESAAHSVSTETLSAETASAFVIPDDDEETTEDAFYIPSFSDYDANGNGVITTDEYRARLALNRDDAISRVNQSDLSDNEKSYLISRLQSNFEKQLACVTSVASKNTLTNGDVTEDGFSLFYTLLTEFCLVEDVKIPEAYQAVEVAPEPQPLTTEETSEPSTTLVVDTPEGPTVVEIPAVEEGDQTTTIVLETPSGPEVVEIPVAEEGEPSTTIVVDTPTGPAVIEVPTEPWSPEIPTDTPTVSANNAFAPEFPAEIPHSYDAPTMAPSGSFMTKEAFKVKIAQHFDTQYTTLNQDLAFAQLEASKASMLKDLLEECVAQAANKFGWYGVYEHSDVFDSAVNWISTECINTDF